MSQINYAVMSDQELKRYLLTHRDDQAAFHAYMDRRKLRPQQASIAVDDPDWEEKVIALIQKQMSDRS